MTTIVKAGKSNVTVTVTVTVGQDAYWIHRVTRAWQRNNQRRAEKSNYMNHACISRSSFLKKTASRDYYSTYTGRLLTAYISFSPSSFVGNGIETRRLVINRPISDTKTQRHWSIALQ